MSSGSLKDLLKLITSSAAHLTLPLPVNIKEAINSYIEKHKPQEEQDAQRLQEELLNVYETSFLDHPARLAPFLSILRTLRPALKGSGRSLQWWDKLSTPVMVNLGTEKGLAYEAKDALLEVLAYDEEENASCLEDAQLTSNAVGECLLAMWLEKTDLAAGEDNAHASFVVKHIQMILNAFGKKKPKEFLQLINKIFVKKSSRISALSLLCDFFRHQPPHLHQLLQTPLFDNLLQCLQIDTSTRAISLAITALIMFLPHIPSSAADHLPALFNIYTRLLFWDREREAAAILPRMAPEVDAEDESILSEKQPLGNGKSWDKLSYLLESEDDTVPELLHYFTFLYGLYPINFMSYIRKPQRYLRHANFPGSDDLNIEPAEIRQRSELFRRVHLLHPNFFTLTLESELSDKDRWMKTEAADVVAECMALHVPSDEGPETMVRSRGPSKKTELNSDVPDQSLLDSDAPTPYQSRHNSWRNTQSTAVASPEGYRSSGLHRRLSQTSFSMPSIADSPVLRPVNVLDSPTLPPQMLGSPSNNRLSDMLSSQRSTRSSLYQALTNDSVSSLTHSNNHPESTVDAYLESLSREHAPRSPSLRPTKADTAPALQVAYLQREIQLLKNDLNFERYLKQQHQSHIGQLRSQLIREARAEAETQNLVNSNRTLKAKLEEAKRLILQTRTETDKSKAHSRKWEGDVSAKLRVLRDEQKRWIKDLDEKNLRLDKAHDDVSKLTKIIVETEAKELRAMQKVESVENSLDELERLRVEVEQLKRQAIAHEARELAASRALENEQAALNQVELLQMELKCRDVEVAKAKHAFETRLKTSFGEAFLVDASRADEEHSNSDDEAEYETRSEETIDTTINEKHLNQYRGNENKGQPLVQDIINEAMKASRERYTQLEQAYSALLNRQVALQESFSQLLEDNEKHKGANKALLSQDSKLPSPLQLRNRSNTGSTADYLLPSMNSITSLATLASTGSSSSDAHLIPKSNQKFEPNRKYPTLAEVDTTESETPRGSYSKVFFQSPRPFSPPPTTPATSGTGDVNSETDSRRGSSGSGSSQKSRSKKKDVPRVGYGGQMRPMYGRGGPQNFGLKDKHAIKERERREKAAAAAAAAASGSTSNPQPSNQEPKKEKRTLGLKGLRGFV